MANKLKELLVEAKRRRVFRTAGVYLVAVWGISSGGVDVASVLGIPVPVLRTSILVAVAFLPVVVILAWMFDIGRSGIVRDPEDVMAEQVAGLQADQDLANMSTMIGGEAGPGAVVVRWSDSHGENAMLYVDEFYLGRGVDCRVRFYDPLISRRHARVFHEDGVWFIEDLGSRNGTHVDGQRIEHLPLATSNVVRLNDKGPNLGIDLVAAGEQTRAALAAFPQGQKTAHVRLPTANIAASSRPATWKK